MTNRADRQQHSQQQLSNQKRQGPGASPWHTRTVTSTAAHTHTYTHTQTRARAQSSVQEREGDQERQQNWKRVGMVWVGALELLLLEHEILVEVALCGDLSPSGDGADVADVVENRLVHKAVLRRRLNHPGALRTDALDRLLDVNVNVNACVMAAMNACMRKARGGKREEMRGGGNV